MGGWLDRMPPSKSTKAAPRPSALGEVSGALHKLTSSYESTTPARFKLIDAFLLFLFITGVAQFVYCALLSNYPFNSFIAGFASTVGQFVLAMALRIQTNPAKDADKGEASQGRYVAKLTQRVCRLSHCLGRAALLCDQLPGLIYRLYLVYLGAL